MPADLDERLTETTVISNRKDNMKKLLVLVAGLCALVFAGTASAGHSSFRQCAGVYYGPPSAAQGSNVSKIMTHGVSCLRARHIVHDLLVRQWTKNVTFLPSMVDGYRCRKTPPPTDSYVGSPAGELEALCTKADAEVWIYSNGDF